jgi:hemerythrin
MVLSNSHPSLNRNLRFIGLLDSAKTAHPVSSANEMNNWWMPSEMDTHLLHCAAAEATAIKQVLWGEMLQLPRNQSFDSPAWFKLGDYFVKSELPLFSICVLGKSATPEAFVNDCAQQFEPASSFALSAWPGLTDDQRRMIAGNIKRQGNFKGMFKGWTLDSQWKSTFQKQQSVLQRMLEYLEKRYKLEPQLIRAVNYPQTSTWHRIERDYQDPKFIENMSDKYGEDLASGFRTALEEIKAKAQRDIGDEPKKIEGWLSSRTNLYQEIYHQTHQLREILRAEIDRCYVETTSESMTGIGRFSDADRSDTQRPVDQRFHDSLLQDADNDPSGLQEYYVIDFEHIESQQKSIEDFIKVLNDKGLAKRIRILRRIRSYPELEPNHIAEIEQEHLNELCQELPYAVIQCEQVSFRLIWRAGQLLISIIPGLSNLIEVWSNLKDIAKEIDNEQVEDVLNKTNLRDIAGERISRKRRVALAGILRDWLTKPIRIDDRKAQ